LHSCETPTTWSINPRAPAISVAAGKSETIRLTSHSTQFLPRKTEQSMSKRRSKKKETQIASGPF
jgi:hypothetical protein